MAVFGFAYIPWFKPHQKLLPQEALPKTEQRVELFLQTVEAFTKGGYRLIGLDHFALESDELARAQAAGTMFRNFQGYTVRPATDTVAFGMSSISDIGGAYAQNSHKLKDWADQVEAGIIPVDRGAAMSDDDVLRRFVINRVMCQLRLDLDEVEGAVRRAGARRHRGLAPDRARRAGRRRPGDLRRPGADGDAARPAAGPQRGHALRRLPAEARRRQEVLAHRLGLGAPPPWPTPRSS